MAQLGLSRLIFETARTHTHTVGFCLASDQPLADTANYTTHNTQQTTRGTNSHALSGIRTYDTSNQVPSDY
jgi:hypothetical protein